MRSALRRATTRHSATPMRMQRRAAHGTIEERAAGIAMWKRISAVGLGVVALKLVWEMGFADHPHPDERPGWEYEQTRKKRFPWGDGQSSLFGDPRNHGHGGH